MDKNEAPYNRIVIIGNGFDKALGLKTGYSDFMLYLLKKALLKALNREKNPRELINVSALDEGLRNFYHKTEQGILSKLNFLDLKNYLKEIGVKYKYSFDFLQEIEDKFTEAKWVDIEQHYFKSLIKIFNEQKDMTLLIQNAESLHKCMRYLRFELNEYIHDQEISHSINYAKYPLANLIEKTRSPLRKAQSNLIGKHKRRKPPSKILFLNFNYTNVLENYLNNTFDNKRFKHIYIHGKVEDDANPIIFGYGDDTRNIYKELENTGEEELLIMIKAFQYPRTSNYHKLLLFLRDYEYDVFVIGHSCGLSDSTLLNTIFEDPNCMAIQAFYYKDIDEFIRKNLAISRHFNDKKLFRERVLIFDKDAKIPQVT